MSEARISVTGLTMAYGDFVVMRDLTFDINKGDIFIIMGGSGCGKSTLLSVLVGLKKPAKGSVLYGEQSLWGASSEQRETLLRGTGVLFQSGALWSSMTLAENIALPLGAVYGSQTQGNPRAGVTQAGSGRSGRVLRNTIRPKSAAACANGRAWHAPWPWTPESCSLTNLRPGSIRSAAYLLDELIKELRDSLEATIVVVTHELGQHFFHRDQLGLSGRQQAYHDRHRQTPRICCTTRTTRPYGNF